MSGEVFLQFGLDIALCIGRIEQDYFRWLWNNQQLPDQAFNCLLDCRFILACIVQSKLDKYQIGFEGDKIAACPQCTVKRSGAGNGGVDFRDDISWIMTSQPIVYQCATGTLLGIARPGSGDYRTAQVRNGDRLISP